MANDNDGANDNDEGLLLPPRAGHAPDGGILHHARPRARRLGYAPPPGHWESQLVDAVVAAGRLLHARPGPAPPPGGDDEPMEDADQDEEEIAETPAIRGEEEIAETPTVRGPMTTTAPMTMTKASSPPRADHAPEGGVLHHAPDGGVLHHARPQARRLGHGPPPGHWEGQLVDAVVAAGRLLHARPSPAPPPRRRREPMEDADWDEEEIAQTPAVRGEEEIAATPTVRGQFLVDGITLEEKNMQLTSNCCVRFEIDPSNKSFAYLELALHWLHWRWLFLQRRKLPSKNNALPFNSSSAGPYHMVNEKDTFILKLNEE